MGTKALVVHCKRDKFDVYIGRPSKWGNPFEIGKDGDRQNVVDEYRKWVLTQSELMSTISELRGKVLGCWCAPHACHGDVLSELANVERELMDYPNRLCVAGSRTFNNKQIFGLTMKLYVSRFKAGTFAFISGAASKGADRMIINWCRAHNVPCFEYEADWDQFGKRAGYIRNAEMRKVLTHLLAFWDGESKGTLEMITNTMKMEEASAEMILVTPDPNPNFLQVETTWPETE